MRPSKAFALVSLLLVLLAACGKSTPPVATASLPPTGAPPWPAPADAMTLARKAGLEPETHETLVFHVHAHLDVFVNGKPVLVPAGIGIDIHDPAVKSGPGPSYGGISTPCAKPCISPLHTHDTSGILHTEAKTAKPNTLGEFFIEWDVRLDRSCVGGFCSNVQIVVNGAKFTGDPRLIDLTDRKEIVIVIGSPPSEVPTKFPG